MPEGFAYPSSYKSFVSSTLPDLEPWHFFYNRLEFRFNGLKQRYPKRTLIPFAKREDNDDVACFELLEPSNNPKAVIIHDWASEGWESGGEYSNFLAWVELAKAESQEWKDIENQ